MSEIKFRAWLPHAEHKMYYDIGVVRGKPYFENTRLVYESSHKTLRKGDNKPKWEYHLMQYTGLKDKNGKEIYEGDIVHHGKNTISEVKFKDGAFTIAETCLYYKRPSELTIEGNIYENPELLADTAAQAA